MTKKTPIIIKTGLQKHAKPLTKIIWDNPDTEKKYLDMLQWILQDDGYKIDMQPIGYYSQKKEES